MNFSSTTSPASCEADFLFGLRLQHPSPWRAAFFIFLIIFNILTFPITAVLNALVMISINAKSQLRAHKSNILLAFLALTDFTVGILVQPTFAAVLIMLLLDEPRGYCVLQVLRYVIIVMVNASLFHLVLLSGERYIAMKHTFGYPSLVTEGRLLVSCALAWFLSVLQTVLLLFNEPVFWGTKIASDILSLVAIFFCHVTVFRETRRHEQQVAAQQATLRARNEFERNKKAVKLTAIILAVLMLCLVPSKTAVMLLRFASDTAKEAFFTVFLSSHVLSFLNSLLNPIIYVVHENEAVQSRFY